MATISLQSTDRLIYVIKGGGFCEVGIGYVVIV
jgi:hypothetical protein